MQRVELLGQRQIDFALRPIRLAYLIRKGSITDFRKVVEEATSRWGGISELIIPFDSAGLPDPYWQSALDLSMPDYLCVPDVVDLKIRHSLSIALGRDLLPLSVFSSGPFGLHQSAVQDWSAIRGRGVAVAAPKSAAGAAAACGLVLNRAQRESWQANGVRLTEFSMWAQIAVSQLNGATLIDWTRQQLTSLPGSQIGGGSALVWVTADGALDDAVAFWNHRAMFPIAFPRSPVALVTKEALVRTEVIALLEAGIRQNPEIAKPDLILASASLSKDELTAVAEEIGWSIYRARRASVTRRFGGALRRQPVPRRLSAGIQWEPSIFLGFRREVGSHTWSLAQLQRPKTLVSAEAPVRFATYGGEIRARFSGAKELSMPPGETPARLFHEKAMRVADSIEIQTAAQQSYVFELQLPERADLLKASLSEHGCTYTLGRKGQYAEGVRRLSADLDFMREPLTIPVVRAMTTHRIQHDAMALRREFAEMSATGASHLAQSLHNVRQVDLSLNSLAGRMRVKAKAVAPVLGRLVSRGIAIRGLRVDCLTCGYPSFVELSEAGPEAVCPACFAPARYLGVTEPTLHYRLNAMVDRASDNGVLVHLLVWAQLARREPDVYAVPGADLIFHGEPCEVDVLALLGSEIWLSEAKTHATEFKEEEVLRDFEIAVGIKASNYALACLESVPMSIVEQAVKRGSDTGISVWLLQGASGNLEPINQRQEAK